MLKATGKYRHLCNNIIKRRVYNHVTLYMERLYFIDRVHFSPNPKCWISNERPNPVWFNVSQYSEY